MTYKTYNEDELLPLSGLQHILFCERQCALIHIEQIWDENLFTAEGRIMHERVDAGGNESRGNIKISCSVPIRSLKLGLSGKADVVEFHRKAENSSGNAKAWLPFPVEHKRGKPKIDDCDRVQLCAQAICLEEMLNVVIEEGALFYGKTRRREKVFFDEKLRKETEDTALRFHELIKSGKTPLPVYNKRCKSCSLNHVCMPDKIKKRFSVDDYLLNSIGE